MDTLRLRRTPAIACLDRTIGWDRGLLLPDMKDNFGDIAVDQCAGP